MQEALIVLFSCVNFFIFSDWRFSSSARDVMIYAHEHESDRGAWRLVKWTDVTFSCLFELCRLIVFDCIS